MDRPPLAAIREILCVRLDGMGDVLMTTPAIRAMRESAPGARLTLLASVAGAEIGRMVPEVDRVIAYAAPWMKAGEGPEPSGDPLAIVDKLAAGQFELAVIFGLSTQSVLPAALACYQAGIPYRTARTREKAYGLLSHAFGEDPESLGVHDVARQLRLAHDLGAARADEHLSIRVNWAARERVSRRLLAAGLRHDDAWCLLHPGATASSRRYPAAMYGAAAGILEERYGVRVVVAGGPSDTGLAAEVVAASSGRALDFSGRWTLDELVGAIDLAPVVLCNNSVPAHIAAATQTPVVDVYALTNPEHAPWKTPHILLSRDVPCRWCYRSECPEGHHNCLRLVSPEEVAGAVMALAGECWKAEDEVLADAGTH